MEIFVCYLPGPSYCVGEPAGEPWRAVSGEVLGDTFSAACICVAVIFSPHMAHFSSALIMQAVRESLWVSCPTYVALPQADQTIHMY